MASDLENIINRINNLKNMTVENGCTLEEQKNAITLAARLMAKNNIEMTDISLSEQSCESYTHKTGTKKMQYTNVALATARLCDCLVHVESAKEPIMKIDARTFKKVVSGYREVINFVFFGLKSDLLLVEYLMSTIVSSYRRSANEFKLTPEYKNSAASKLSLTNTYMQSFYQEIENRLNLMKEQLDLTQAQSDSKTLVVVKNDKIDKEYNEVYGSNFKTVSRKRRVANHSDAIFAGQDAASKVSLNRPVAHTST